MPLGNFSTFRRLAPSRRGYDISGAPEQLLVVLLVAFLIEPHSFEEPQPGWPFLPSLLPGSHGFCGNLLREGISFAPILPGRVGWSTSHPSSAVVWVGRRPCLVDRPVFGLGSHWGAGVGIKTLSTIWAPCCSLPSKHKLIGQHWSCPLWSPAGTTLPSGKGGDLVGKEGWGWGYRSSNLLCGMYLLMDL